MKSMKRCVFAVLFAALIALQGCVAKGTTQERLGAFIDKHQNVWQQVFADASGKRVDNQSAQTAALKQVFRSSPLESVDDRNGDGRITLYLTYSHSMIIEGSVYLTYDPAFDPAQNGPVGHPGDGHVWRMTQNTEGLWRWEGGAVGGKGWMQVERLRPDWYYVSCYLPT